MDSLPNPLLLLVGLLLVSLAPFMAILISSFIKLVVVMFMLRSALGLQQAPPNLAINGLAIILSIYIMAPVGFATHEIWKSHNVDIQDIQNPLLTQAVTESIEPMRSFLKKHSNENERNFFAKTTRKLWPKEYSDTVTHEHFLVLIPAFTISELKSAFETGFLLFLPFLVIDLVISNILLAMGMIMVSPMMISLPFKILLFVMVDGWTRLVHGLVLSYQ